MGKHKFFESCKQMCAGTAHNPTPLLEVNGRYYFHATAILRYVGRTSGLYPKRPDDQYLCDKIMQEVEDLRAECYKPMPMFGGSKGDQAGLVKLLPSRLGIFETLLGKKNMFFLGSGKPTLSDVAVFDLLDTLIEPLLPGKLDEYPDLKAFRERMRALPAIKKWHDSNEFKSLWTFPAFDKPSDDGTDGIR